MEPKTLYEVAAELGGVSLQQVEALGKVILQLPQGDDSGLRFQSTLNNDGSPLQVCSTSSASARSVRLLGDPGSFLSSPGERLAEGRRALTNLVHRTGNPETALLCERVLDAILPEHLAQLAPPIRGVLWLATDLDSNSMALYVKAMWGAPEIEWLRTVRLLRSILPCSDEAEALVQELRGGSRIVSVGVETAMSGSSRIKLYWRLNHPVPLSSLNIDLLNDAAIEDFLSTVIGHKELPLTGLVLSAGFALATGALQDVKVDVCGHCIAQPPAAWLAMIDGIAERHHLGPVGLGNVLMGGRADVAFVGLGIDRRRDKRLNVYLKLPGAGRDS